MANNSISIPSVVLPDEVPDALPEPKFQLGQHVRWNYVPSQDFGRILGIIFASEGSVRAAGYHYAIALSKNSPSYAYAYGTMRNWRFEDDLEQIAAEVEEKGGVEQ